MGMPNRLLKLNVEQHWIKYTNFYILSVYIVWYKKNISESC